MESDLPSAGRFEGREHHLPLRVYFEDTDFSGLVYHANYLRYFERARSDMLRCAGIDQKAAYEKGEGVYAVSELSIKYRRPARYDDALIITSVIRDIRAASVHIHQRVIRDDELLAEADVVAAFISRKGRAKRQPKAWINAFKHLLGD